MNFRCYRCSWSFTLGRETIEAAVASAGQDKIYALPCPRCRQINKIPLQQLKRSLPPGWTPPPPPAPDTAEAEMPAASAPSPAPVAADLASDDTPALSTAAMESEDNRPKRKTKSSAEPPAKAKKPAQEKAPVKKTTTKKTTTKKSSTP